MKMKRILLSTLAGCGLAIGVQAATFYYDPNGSGTWSDASRWKEKSGTPGEADTVRVSTGEALVTDADIEVLQQVASVVLDNETAKLIISNDTDIVLSTYISGKGEVVKEGVGEIEVAAIKVGTGAPPYQFPFSNPGGWKICRGTVKITNPNQAPTVRFQNPLGVYAPGVLVFSFPVSYNLQVPSLEGDGKIVSDGEDNRLINFYAAPKGGVTRVFSGEVEGLFKYTQGSSASQSFSGTGCKLLHHDSRPDLYGGYLGFDEFPKAGIIFRENSKVEWTGDGSTRVTSLAEDCNLNNNAQVVEFSAGAYGNFELKYKFQNPGNKYTMNEMIFSGDNEKTAIFNGLFKMGTNNIMDKLEYLACYIKKTGTGTWRFTAADKANRGTVAVEKGTLEYESIAEKGTSCSLGDASILHREYTGVRDNSKYVPYAYLLGDGTVAEPDDPTVATMKYVGTSPAAISTRPVAVKGSGRFSTETAKVAWSGFTSATEGNNEIILGGDVADCRAYGVTNGIGTLSVAKEGSGDWTIDGNFDFSGGVEAREGTLKINASRNYGWYKLTLKENWSGAWTNVGGGDIIWISQFGLFDSKGTNWIEGLTHNKAANGKVWSLKAGEAAFNHKNFEYHTKDGIPNSELYSLENAFNSSQSVVAGYRSWGNRMNYTVNPLENPDAWVEIVVRPNETTNALVRYDIRSWGHSDSENYRSIFVREPRSWSLEGSMDGVNWETLDTVISNATPTTGAIYRWIGTNRSVGHNAGEGLGPIASETSQDGFRPTSVASVSAAAGATVKVNAPLVTSKIKCDYVLGGGTIEGFVFADGNGVIEIVNAPEELDSPISVPVTLVNVGGIENLSSYSVVINGDNKVWKGRYADGCLHVNPPGTVVVIR